MGGSHGTTTQDHWIFQQSGEQNSFSYTDNSIQFSQMSVMNVEDRTNKLMDWQHPTVTVTSSVVQWLCSFKNISKMFQVMDMWCVDVCLRLDLRYMAGKHSHLNGMEQLPPTTEHGTLQHRYTDSHSCCSVGGARAPNHRPPCKTTEETLPLLLLTSSEL